MRLALVLILVAAALGWWGWSRPVRPAPELIAGLSAEGLSGAPCPARSIYEQDARRKRGPQPSSVFALRLREKFPLGTPGEILRETLTAEGFETVTPCANDDSVLGARWRGRTWGAPDAYVYWRVDLNEKLIFLDGHVSRAD
ncbi:hypothetical protein SAMN06265338_10414 [Rhodoblastus acidophilus]|uniref:Uncharacterized protein n=1 Tax=Rhodoblastus acidophilus TaxID=1074 RepID=A0A212REG9_RHOAC|nr:hypothetical protein [Rhodoblastus acidophilus]PPQ39723.1 hypothetical protein CKO16_05710 [Rhodoblastus acidophilus]RAI16802.1 hypothetical protein CH337_19565 [Rhodoblastus acidophilus]SNB70733.1 hypothetical protein SAMN06265338_10414 [Rhodoblastus acidophilus]